MTVAFETQDSIATITIDDGGKNVINHDVLDELEAAGVTVHAVMPRSLDDVADLLKMVGGAPAVIKLLEGTQGLGVVLAETRNAAKSVIEAFMGLKANILVQEYSREAGGADIRCFVIGDKVMASMKRSGKEGEFRSNLHRGGSAELVRITPEERSTAVRSARIMGLNVAGVDLLRSNHGPVVMEVNSSPGLEGIEAATGKDVAGEIIEYMESHVDVAEELAVEHEAVAGDHLALLE